MTAIHPHTYMHTYTHTYTQQQCSPENLFVYIKLSYNKVTTPQYSFVFLFLVVRSKCYKNPNIPIHPSIQSNEHSHTQTYYLLGFLFGFSIAFIIFFTKHCTKFFYISLHMPGKRTVRCSAVGLLHIFRYFCSCLKKLIVKV